MQCRLWLRRGARTVDIMMTHADYKTLPDSPLLSLYCVLAHGECSVLLLLLLRLQRCLRAKHPRSFRAFPAAPSPHGTAALPFDAQSM